MSHNNNDIKVKQDIDNSDILDDFNDKDDNIVKEEDVDVDFDNDDDDVNVLDDDNTTGSNKNDPENIDSDSPEDDHQVDNTNKQENLKVEDDFDNIVERNRIKKEYDDDEIDNILSKDPVNVDESEYIKTKVKNDVDDLLDKNEDDEEEEEDDDEDEEDEEDEDEDETSRRRKKRKGGNQFLDVEAEVDDEDEEEEDEEDEALRNEFLEDDPLLDNAANEASRSHRKLDRTREKMDEQDAQALADQFKARYGRSSSQRYMGSTQNISQRLLLPSVEDPLIWGIRVRNGKEKDLVKQIYARMLNMKGTQEVFSVFQRDSFSGYIYIEARRMDAVNHILESLPGIYNNVGKVLVPIEEYPDLLRPGSSQESRLKPGSYVRVRIGRYKGDLGIVDNLAENDLEVRVKLVPRLDYGRSNNSTIDPNTGKKRMTNFNSKFRPPQRLFSDIEAQQYDPEHLTTAKRDRNYYLYKNEEYINGFLYKDIKVNQLETQNVKPTLHELTLFDSMKDSDGIDLQSVASALKNVDEKAISFQPNDRVEIISGEQSKMKGKILSIAEATVARVLLEGNENDTDINNTIVEVPTSSLRKIFLPGDHVTVIHGVHKDESGLIVDVKNNQVTLVSNQTKKDITVFPNYLVISVDSSTTSSKIGRFELHQMVNLNSHKIGMIIKVEKEVFTILCTDGRVLKLEPKNIVSTLDVNRMTEKTTDRNGLEIKVGDVVRETSGEKRQGNIMHIYKSFLFLHSKTVYENTGVFVTDSNSVQTIANKGSIASSTSSFKVPDLNKMNPNRLPAPPVSALANQARFGGRDMTINQHVSVRKGPYKGKKGIIKDANGDVARVEMHNPAKIIPINKSELLFELRPGNYVPHEQFLENYRGKNANYNNRRPINGGSYRGGAPGGSYGMPSSNQYNGGNSIRDEGGKTPSWSSGGKTPSWGYNNSGGKTPSWGSNNSGGKTPSWGSNNSGGKTPSWGSNNSGGKTPSWGSNNSGGKTPSWGSNNSGGKTPSWGSNNSGGKTPSWGSSNNGGKTPSWGSNNSGGKTPAWNSGNRSSWAAKPASANEAQCVREFVTDGQLVVVTVQSTGRVGDGQILSMRITNSDGDEYRRKDDIAGNIKVAFSAHETSSFDICFTNRLQPGYNPKNGRQSLFREIELEVEAGANARDWNAIQSAEKLKPSEVQLRKVDEMLEEVITEMEYLVRREERLRDTNESTNVRVKNFFVMGTLMLISVGVYQVYYLRNYFRSKHIL
ncbi:transcription elongation factor spt5 [Pichia californica]|nr:transcription elongation factor spt5 [[Candida] californica]